MCSAAGCPGWCLADSNVWWHTKKHFVGAVDLGAIWSIVFLPVTLSFVVAGRDEPVEQPEQ